jgi:hypothetical protein
VVTPAVAQAEKAFEAALTGVTIEALCQEAEKAGLIEAEATADFNI